MRVIGLDLGTSMGWAFTDSDQVEPDHSGTWDFAPHRLEGGGYRFLRFRCKLEDLLVAAGLPAWRALSIPIREELRNASEPRVAVYFEVASRRADQDRTGNIAREVYGGFLGILTELCERYGVPYQGVRPATLKTRATGKGNAPKAAVLVAAEQVFGYQAVRHKPKGTALRLPLPAEHDRADALWILQVGLDRLGLPAPLNPGG